jgi:glycerophosphoryl diester phosphodiesterase
MCAHRGFNTIAPENSMPAFGAAVALGAEEIEFDLWMATDGTIVSCHDPRLDRVSTGSGYIWKYSYEELLQYDFGIKHGPEFAGLKVPTFEDILKKFAYHTVMNIHIKSMDDINPVPEEMLTEIIRLIDKYDCRKYSYFMSGNPAILGQLQRLAPDIARCAGATNDPFEDLVDKAIKYECKKIQLFQPHFKKNEPDYVAKAIKKAHDNGVVVNVFYADTVEEARHYLELGADTILTNDYQRVSAAADGFEKYLRR